MKEPITGRDLFVISAICTGFGALLAWGLFYRWGTSPTSKPIDWSAWVQAVGSVAGIFVAIAVPMRIHSQREAIERRGNQLRARGFALVLLPMAEQFLSNLQIARAYALGDDGADPSFEAAIKRAAVPEQLQSRVTELHDLGPPAEGLQRAIAKTSQLRQRLQYSDFYTSNGGMSFNPYTHDMETLPEPEDPIITLDEAREELRRAILAMNAMFE